MTGRLRAGLWATAGYAVLTAILTWPVVAQLRTAVAFYNDTFIFLWNLESVRAALLDPARAVYFSDQVFFPEGISLAFHTLAPLYGALAVPAVPAVGLVATYNLLFLLTFVATGLGGYALARELGVQPWSAFIAGALFTYSPFHQVHAPHLNLLSLQFLPLTAIAAARFNRSAAWRDGLFLAATGVLAFYACHEYALFAAILAAMVVIVTRARSSPGRPHWRDLLGRGLGVAALALGLAAPGIVPMLAEAAIESHYAEAVDADYAADLLSWVTPSVLHSWWGGYTMKVYQYFPGVLAEWTTFIGLTVAILCLIGIRTGPRRDVTLWVLVALVFGVLAMGPSLRILGQSTGLPLPYRLLKSLPVLSAMREPSRFAAGVTLATSILAGFGLEFLIRRYGRRAAWLLPVALIEFSHVPLPMSPTKTPEFLGRLAQDPTVSGLEPGAILDVPSGLEFREHLYHQAVHQRPILLGYVARIPAASRRFLATTPVLRDPANWPAPGDPQRALKIAEFAIAARDLGVRYALVHADFYRRRGQPAAFTKAVAALLELPGARLAATEPGFAAIELSGIRAGSRGGVDEPAHP